MRQFPKRIASCLSASYDAALSLLYPERCAVCLSESVDARGELPACASCWARTRVFQSDDVLCWKCGAPSQGRAPEGKSCEIRCRRCEGEYFTAARACGIYEGALRASVLRLKKEPHVSSRLAGLLCETARSEPLATATRIIPVPLHPEREFERGFNQAALLGRSLAAQLKLTFDENSLVRRTHTKRHRAGMDVRARRETVEGAFEVTRPRLVSGESVLLVDDVFTTGATASACARALLEGGAREVFVITVARA